MSILVQRYIRILSLLPLICAAGCQARYQEPNLGGLYNRTIAASEEFRNPVIVIPGILGSRLVEANSRQVVWGAFRGDYADPDTPEGARLVALPMQKGLALAGLKDDVVPAGALDVLSVRILGLPIELGAYVNILSTLGAGGYRDQQLGESKAIHYADDHFTCFQFDYDWRRDIVENAQRLNAFILEKQAYVQSTYLKRFGHEKKNLKFDIVAHSMGGLVARYFLEYGSSELSETGAPPPVTWDGAKLVDKVVLVGTPSAGAVDALIQLVDGIQFAPLFPKYEAAVLGTMPSIYELLPRSRHAHVVDAEDPKHPIDDLYDPALWEKLGWGLASPEQDRVLQVLLPDVSDPAERRSIALEHQRKCLARARALFSALDVPAHPPEGLTLRLIAGDATPTSSVLAVNFHTGAVKVIQQEPGDGSVLRTSALMDERVGGEWTPKLVSPIAWNQVNFLFSDHLGMTRDPMFTDNLLYYLLEDPGTQ